MDPVREAQREHALRMIEHLRREFGYGYPKAVVLPLLRQTDRAIRECYKPLPSDDDA
jgi:hypothetical protein